MAKPSPSRPPLAVTLSVWRALFLRESLARVSQFRRAWLWLIVEPVAHITILLWLFAAGFRGRVVAGGDVGVFLMLGVLGFFMVRNTMIRCMDAIESSDNLFAFRQIRPVDTVLVRGVCEGLLNCIVFIVMVTGAALLGKHMVPDDGLAALEALFGLWLLGLGLGLVFSVISTLVPEFGRLVRLMTTPLYFFSAVMIPSVVLPVSIREVLLLNPILNGLEALRLAFMPTYLVPQGLDVPYLYECALVTIVLGLALQARYRLRLITL